MISRERVIERVGRQLGELDIGDQFVEHGLDAHQRAGGDRLVPGHAHQPAHRRHDVAEQALQRDRRRRRRPAAGSRMALARCTSATSTISMATMLSRSSSPADGAAHDGVHGESATGPILISPMSLRSSGGTGTISPLIRSAAGALMMEAIRMWPATSGMTFAEWWRKARRRCRRWWPCRRSSP